MRAVVKHVCSRCHCETFKLQDIQVPVNSWAGKEIRTFTMLVCTQCKRTFNIQPCNTNGLIDKKDIKESGE